MTHSSTLLLCSGSFAAFVLGSCLGVLAAACFRRRFSRLAAPPSLDGLAGVLLTDRMPESMEPTQPHL